VPTARSPEGLTEREPAVRRPWLLCLLAACLLLFGAAACGDDDDDDDTAGTTDDTEEPTTTASDDGTTTSAAGGGGSEIAVKDFEFDPADASVSVGDAVTFTWEGEAPHNVTFDDGEKSDTQESGTFERTFDTAGDFPYQCTVHPQNMKGTVTVA
jgi:plastocyanin